MDETLPDIAKRILEAMAEQGFDRPVDLARAVNVSKQTVGDWIKGRTTNIRPDHLVRLADVLRVEIRWLAVGKGPRRARSPTPPDVIEATDILAVMPPEQRNAYLTILKSSKAA